MIEKSHVTIIALVGLSGSGKSMATHYLAEHGMPKVFADNQDELVSEVEHIANAGQHMIAVDGITTLETLRALKHNYKVHTVLLFAPAELRAHRESLHINQLNERDWQEIEERELGTVLALADSVITNTTSAEQLYAQLDSLIQSL
ncbi:hypothetical protein KBD87_03105 [Candidatus Saccharibacteria bacterium]|nr:hypothetical protein [Candidatus Saccharibacteria bacterium]